MRTFPVSVGAWGLILLVGFAATTHAQTPAVIDDREPDYKVQVWAHSVEDFTARVWAYFALRSRLQAGLAPFTITNNPAETDAAQRALARRLRDVRAGARQGEFFTPAIEEEFKRVLIVVVDADTRSTIMADNPGSFARRINRTYDKSRPVSTIPPNILALLPTLPADLQYRFLGRHLILHDTRANVIVDRLPYAIRCGDCDDANRRP